MALAGLLLAAAADAALLYSWPYGLPAATAQANYGTSARHVCCVRHFLRCNTLLELCVHSTISIHLIKATFCSGHVFKNSLISQNSIVKLFTSACTLAD